MSGGDDQATVGFVIPPGLSALAVRYDLLGEVGRGGMGIVYKARDRRTGDLVAIKALHPSIASDPSLIERFKNELLLARRITHKNVCRVYDLEDFGGATVISMEFVDGRSLRAMLRDVESVSVRQGLKVVGQIAAGLAEAHTQGIVHRDLKPENVLIDKHGAVKIMDFGVARLIDSHLTVTGQLLGTPAYMSPEQVEGKPVDARSDIYSLGLVMYEMFCGRPAFSGDTPVAIIAKHLGETPVPPLEIEADLPVRIDQAIRRCLEKHPARRFQTVAELEAALSAGTAVSADTAAPDDAAGPEHAGLWTRRDWGLVAAAAIGVTVFFQCFARVSLAPRSQVTFDRQVLQRVAGEHLQQLGVSPMPVRRIRGDLDVGAFVYLGGRYGAASARDAANNPIPYWTWSVEFAGASLALDHRGHVVAFSRPVVPVDPGGRAIEDAKRQATKAVQDFFGQDASTLALERETQGQVYGFDWLGSTTAPGLRMRYGADIDRLGVSALRQSPDLPSEYARELFPFGEVTMNEWGLPVAVVISVLVSVIGFFNRRRVALGAPWRTAIVGVSFAAGAGLAYGTIPDQGGPGIQVAMAIALGVLYAVVMFPASIALEAFLKAKRPAQLDALVALLSRGRVKTAAGLSWLRGTAIGLILLGVDTCAIWIGTTYFGARLSPIYVGLLGGAINTVAWPLGLILATALAQVTGIGLLVCLSGLVADRISHRRWLSVVGAAACLAASGIRFSMGTVLPWYWTLLVLFVDYAILVVSFQRFDLLTLSVAIGTFAFWWANYPLFVMQQPIGAPGPSFAFVAWGLCIAAAIAVAFQSPLRRGYRRLAMALRAD